jgi:hypothetical protein
MTPWGFADEGARDPQAEAPPPSAGPDDGAVCIFKKDGRAESKNQPWPKYISQARPKMAAMKQPKT